MHHPPWPWRDCGSASAEWEVQRRGARAVDRYRGGWRPRASDRWQRERRNETREVVASHVHRYTAGIEEMK